MPTAVTGDITLLTAPATPPPCFLCSRPSRRYVTRHSNRKGNAGRPYYKCAPCNKFLVFADSRGNEPGNPACGCGHSSKREFSPTGARAAKGVYFVCRMGTCNYYQAGREVLDDETIARFVSLRIA